MPRRSAWRSAAVVLGAFVAVSCLRDVQGPGAGRSARLGLAPAFATAAAGVVEFDRVRVRVARAATAERVERPVVDTMTPFPATADSVELGIRVPLEQLTEEFLVYIQLINAAGDTVFRNAPYPQSVIARAGDVSAVLQATLAYVGIGFDAAGVVITTPDTALSPGATLDLAAVALAADQSVIPGTPIAWSSLDPTLATVPDPAIGRVVAGLKLGSARIEARLPTGPADTINITIR